MAAIRFYKPALYRKDMDAVLQTMVDEKIGPGERKKEFIRLFLDLINKKQGFALRTYYDAILFSLKSLSLEKGDEVFVSVLTPRIYLEAFKELEINPVLVDVDDSMIIDIDYVLNNKSDKTKALILFEPICQVVRNIDAFKDTGLLIIEDISQSIGSSYGEIKPGVIGDVVLASTEEDGIVSTGGGAFVATDSEDIGDNIKKEVSKLSPYVELPDMNAALGIVQITKLENILLRRDNIYKVYIQAVKKTNCKLFGSASMDFHSNGYGFSVIVNSKPDEMIAFASKYQVSAKKTFSNAIGSRYQDRFDRFPKAIPALTRGLSFPIYPFLSSVEIESIQKVISHLH